MLHSFLRFSEYLFDNPLIFMVQVQGYDLMAGLMWFCMSVETAARLCELTYSIHLQAILTKNNCMPL